MRARRFLVLVVLLTLLGMAESRGAEADPDLAFAEKRLQEAGVAADGPALMAFFQKRTLDEAGRKRLADTVRRLGASAYPARQRAFKDLLAAGRSALPFVRQALTDPDPEIASRARRLVSQLESGTETTLIVAAARVLASRRPAGAVPALLGYLPQAGEEQVEEAVLEALAATGLNQGKVHLALAEALHASEPLHRLAAAYVYSKAPPGDRAVLRPLLDDRDPRVRYEAAAALVQAGDRAAVPPLLALLEIREPEGVAWRAEDLLLRIAGGQAPQASLGNTPAERQVCRRTWTDWWKAHETRIDLAKINFQTSFHNLTLVCDCDTGKNLGGRLWEFGPDGKERWNYTGVRVIVDIQLLPGGRMLIAEGAASQATERDRSGKVLNVYRVQGYATTARRLPNGNTLLSGYNEIKEVTPQGKVVLTYRSPGGAIYRVQRLPNGHLVFVAGASILELDAKGTQVRSLKIPGIPGNVSIWAHAEKLPGGRYLVALYGENRVLELSPEGKILFQVDVKTPSSVMLLPSGNILVSSMDARKIVEFNRQGKEVWSKATQGRPFLVRRY